METVFKCPYCYTYTYSSSSKSRGNFTNWYAVIQHTSKCTSNSREFVISEIYGPIHYSEFLVSSLEELLQKFPKLPYSDFLKKFKKAGIIDKSFNFCNYVSNEDIINSIKEFYAINNRIPSFRDFQNNPKYPGRTTVVSHFKTWNNAILAAGFTPNTQSGYGTNTLGLDGHLYRSTAEAYFADNYLYGKYSYDIEPRYPKPYNKYYDWYVKELNLYIELDGGLRPEVIKEKLKINYMLNIPFLVIKTDEIYTKNFSLVTNAR